MFIKIPDNKTTKLVGDKGYVTSEKFKLNNKKRTKMIYPKRKNQKTENTKIELKILKKRGSVERSINVLKKPDRLARRKDRKIENYMGFVYLRLCYSFCLQNEDQLFKDDEN